MEYAPSTGLPAIPATGGLKTENTNLKNPFWLIGEKCNKLFGSTLNKAQFDLPMKTLFRDLNAVLPAHANFNPGNGSKMVGWNLGACFGATSGGHSTAPVPTEKKMSYRESNS